MRCSSSVLPTGVVVHGLASVLLLKRYTLNLVAAGSEPLCRELQPCLCVRLLDIISSYNEFTS